MSGSRSHPDSAEIDAADWLLRIEDGLSADEQLEFARWIESDPARAELMARQSTLLLSPRGERAQAAAPVLTRRNVWRAPAAAGLAAAAAAMTAAVLFILRPDAPTSQPLQIATATGSVSERVLPDASRLWVDAQTEAAFQESDNQRNVALAAGRIFVEVEADPRRPFIVSAGVIEATAVGTAFEVTRFPAYSQVHVAEGRVRVIAAQAEHLLAAGDLLRIDGDGRIQLRAADPAQVGGWRSYRLTFRGVQLSDVLDEINRYRIRPIVVEDPVLASQVLSGVFPVTQADEGATPDMLAAATDAVVADSSDNRIVLVPAGD